MKNRVAYRWNGEFSSPVLESEFRSDNRKADFKIIRLATILTALAYLSGGVANYYVFGVSMTFWVMCAVRLAIFAAAASVFTASYRNIGRQTVDNLILLYFSLVVYGECVEVYLTPTQALPELPGLIFTVLAYYMFVPTRLHLMIIGGLSAGALYSCTVGLTHGTDIQLFANSVFSFILFNAFGIYHVRTMGRSQRMRFQSLKNEKKANSRLQQEIAERKKAQRKLFELATVDELTQLYNRRFFLELA